MAEPAARNFLTAFEDSRRWRNVVRRPGDIVISTPPKSGTTWMQGIVSSLLWPDGDAPGTRGQRSPWVDACMTPIEDLVDQLEQQQHRRFMKTHSPGDCIPFDNRCRYIVVYRDARDALVSWGNHRATMRPEVVRAMNHEVDQRGVSPVSEVWDGDYETLFDEWITIGSPLSHLASWWPRRHCDNVLFVHYADLTVDLEGEMRRVAGFLDISIDESQWPTVVERCTLDAMRAEAEAIGGMDRGFDGGASAFFFKGGMGRGTKLLPAHLAARCLELAAEQLPLEAAAWLEHGSLERAERPSEIGTAPPPIATGGGNPMYWRLRPRSGNSVHAISERRVDQAREEGLFDNLPLHGKPIPDLDRHRPTGWWAQQFVKNERNKVKALQLEEELRAAMPALWRLETEDAVRRRVDELNATIATYNRVTTLEPMPPLDAEATVATWRDLKSR